MHKNIAVCKIMEAMRTAYAKNSTRSQHMDANDHRTYASMWNESAHRLRRTFYFAESFDELIGKGAFVMWHSFLYFFSLAHISKFLHGNVSSTRVQCTHLLKSWRDRFWGGDRFFTLLRTCLSRKPLCWSLIRKYKAAVTPGLETPTKQSRNKKLS